MPYLPSRRFRPAGNYNPSSGAVPSSAGGISPQIAGIQPPPPDINSIWDDWLEELYGGGGGGPPGDVGPSPIVYGNPPSGGGGGGGSPNFPLPFLTSDTDTGLERTANYGFNQGGFQNLNSFAQPRDQAQEYIDAIGRGEPGAIGPGEKELFGGAFGDKLFELFQGAQSGIEDFLRPNPSRIGETGFGATGAAGGLGAELEAWMRSLGNFVLPFTSAEASGAPTGRRTGGGGSGGQARGTGGPNFQGPKPDLQTWLRSQFVSLAEGRPARRESITNFINSAGPTVAQFLEPEPFVPGEGEQIGGLSEGIADFIGNFVLPGTEKFRGATEALQHDRGVGPGTGIFNDLFGQGAGVGALETLTGGGALEPYGGRNKTFFEQGDNLANLQALSDLLGIPIDEIINRGMNPTQIPGAFETGNIMQNAWLASFANQELQQLGTTDAFAPFSGAGGGGGFGGFNFAPGDPADPSFWLDMVRWLI